MASCQQGQERHTWDRSVTVQTVLSSPPEVWPQGSSLQRVLLICSSQSWQPQWMWKEMKSRSLHVTRLSSILNFVASDYMGLHYPAQAWESLSSAATSAISNEICCWKRKLSWPEKDRAFSKACQELTAMERGLHTRTVPLSSYCSAGSCFWSVCTRCQRRVFLNTVINSIMDSTATEASSCRTENWHGITEELLLESDCPMESYTSNAPRKDSMHSAQECSVASTKIRHAERCQRRSRSHFLQEALYLSLRDMQCIQEGRPELHQVAYKGTFAFQRMLDKY